MANYPPKSGEIYTLDGKRFRVVTVDPLTGVKLELLDENNNVISSDIPKVGQRKWENRKYEIETIGLSAKGIESSSFIFAFDDKTGEIVVTSPDGVETARLTSLKGDKGDSAFEDWAKKNGKDPKDANVWAEFFTLIKGKDGLTINGADAPTPFEEWVSMHPELSNPTYTDFIKSITGPKGTNGHEGVDGKDGDTWEPYLSENGILYFENTRTHERTEARNISGIQGPEGNPGKNGETWKPVLTDDGSHLYFINDKGEKSAEYVVKGATGEPGKQGQDGLSAYDIWIKEGYHGDYHDFLLWVSHQAEKGDNGEDGDTFTPHVENGRLFFISKKTGQRIDGGNVVGPQGEKGDPGLNGHNLRHEYDYQSLKDYVCPVQKINTRLITSTSDLGSGDSACNHMKQTLYWINNIRKEGVKKENHGSYIQEFFWWCSGADRRLLRMTRAEHSKYMGIGTVIFFTALMAMVSSFFAISYVFGNSEFEITDWKCLACVAFAFMWGLMIFFLDRFITNTMYSDGKVTISWLELRSALPRILISIFLGIVISAPLELKIFDQEINQYLIDSASKQYKEDLNDSSNIELTSYYSLVEMAKNEYKDAVSNWKKIKDMPTDEAEKKYVKYHENKETTSGTDYARKKNYDTGRTTDEPYTKTTEKTSVELVYDPEAWQAAIDHADTIVQSKKNAREKAENDLQSKKEELLKDFKSNDSMIISQAGLYNRLHALHKIAFKEGTEDGYRAWGSDSECLRFWCFLIGVFLVLGFVSYPFLQNVVKPTKKGVPVKRTKWIGAAVLYPWFLVVAVVFAYCNNALFNALPYFIFSAVGMIMMLFILIDVSPVFYKMMLADGQYEQYLHKEKAVTQDLIRLDFATSISKVNNSEVARLAPMIFSKPYEKIQEIISSAKKEYERPDLSYGEEQCITDLNDGNKEIFDAVLGIKKSLIMAAYQAWYRDMKDCKIGTTDQSYTPDPTDPHPFTPEDFTSDHDAHYISTSSGKQDNNDDTSSDDAAPVNGDFVDETESESSENEYEQYSDTLDNDDVDEDSSENKTSTEINDDSESDDDDYETVKPE